MSEVIERKTLIDNAIGAHDPGLFAAQLLAWLEATVYLRTLPNLRKLGIEPKAIPPFEAADLRDISVRKEADDAVMAFCIAAGLAHDAAGFTSLDRLLTERFGIIYPGSSALYHCNQIIDPIVTLDDAVGQVVKPLLEGADFAPKEIWNAGLRLLQRLRSSNFERVLTPLVAAWLRMEWTRALGQPSSLQQAQATIPRIKACLAESFADQAFIAALLVASAEAIDRAVEPEYLTQLAKLAQRA
jgi:hypothetical protein